MISIEDFSNALEQGRAAVYRLNYDSDSYEYMGEYVKEITGYAADELTPELWESLVVRTVHKAKVTDMPLEEASSLSRAGKIDRWQKDVEIRTRSGETRWVSDMSTVLRDEAGERHGTLGVLLDITERVRATEQLSHRNREMEAELAMAREIQQALVTTLPDHFPLDAADGQIRLEFHHRYIPTEVLAGDFFDIIPLSEHKVGVFICDVVGHGVRAALLTTFLRGLIEELMPQANDPGTFLSKINHGLAAVFGKSETFIFATAFYMVVDTQTNRIRFTNAGHPQPFCLRPDTGDATRLEIEKKDPEPALGIVGNFAYSTSDYALGDTESVLLYTDGMFEVYNGSGEMYGEERVADTLRGKLHMPIEQLLDETILDIHRFAGSDDFEDDVCLLAVIPPVQ